MKLLLNDIGVSSFSSRTIIYFIYFVCYKKIPPSFIYSVFLIFLYNLCPTSNCFFSVLFVLNDPSSHSSYKQFFHFRRFD
ncbi:hypothetical protein CW304_27395 [Bacillus sp. UFRGS-B20]|nr:hypothetical protein CW304_27395 [Bacillus sp. UFRGS-B20]